MQAWWLVRRPYGHRPSLCSVFADVCYVPAVDSDTQWDLPQISCKNIHFASKARHPEALGLTGAPNSPIRPQKHPEPTITQSSSPWRLCGARRGASGADGACTGEGEAAGPTNGVHPAGCQRWAGGGRLTQFHGTERKHKPGLTHSGRTRLEAAVWEYFAFSITKRHDGTVTAASRLVSAAIRWLAWWAPFKVNQVVF